MSESINSLAARMHILIVDDERDNRELLEVIFRFEGFDITAVASGAEALASVARDAPHVILLDVMMPAMNGYQVTAALKSDPNTEKIPVILFSALADPNAKQRGRDAGASDFLAKPIERTELVACVRRFARAAMS